MQLNIYFIIYCVVPTQRQALNILVLLFHFYIN